MAKRRRRGSLDTVHENMVSVDRRENSRAENFSGLEGERFRRGIGNGTSRRISVNSNDITQLTSAGQAVSAETALRLTAWQARTNMIVRGCSKLGMVVRDEDTKDPVSDLPQWATRRPMSDMGDFAFRWRLFHGMATTGWCPMRVASFDSHGYPDKMWPMPVKFCDIHYTGEERLKVIFTPYGRGKQQMVLREWKGVGDVTDVGGDYHGLVYLVRFADDGSTGGANPVQEAAEAIGLGLAAQQHVSSEFATGGMASGMLYLDTDDDDAVESFSDEMDESMADHGARHSVRVTNVKGDWTPFTRTPDEMNSLENREFAVKEVARTDNIPPALMGVDVSTWGSGVAVMRNIMYSLVLSPYLESAQSALTLIRPPGEEVHFPVERMLRGSEIEEEAMLGRSVRDAVRTPNEARREIGLPEREDGDKLMLGKMDKGERDPGTTERQPTENPGSD